MDKNFFTLEQAARIIGLKPKEKWRVIKFVQSKEYGLKSSAGSAAGSGSRRYYELDDLCELALALRLLETGLRSMVIGKIIRQLREKNDTTLNALVRAQGKDADLRLVIIRKPEVGKPLDEKREQIVCWVSTVSEAEKLWSANPARDVILVPVGQMLSGFKHRLAASTVSR